MAAVFPVSGATRTSFLSRFFLRRFILVLATLVALAAIAVGLAVLSDYHDNEHAYVINILGRQRMLSQGIAKDASRMSAIYDAIDSEERVQPVEVLRGKLEGLRIELMDSTRLFGETLSQIQAGRIANDGGTTALPASLGKDYHDALVDTAVLWEEFEAAVRTAYRSRSLDRDFRQALVFINENNGKLLDLSERLTDAVLKSYAQEGRRMHSLSTILVIGLAAMCVWLVLGSYRLLLEPYEVFYLGLRSLGGKDAPARKKKLRPSPLMKEVDMSFAILKQIANIMGTIGRGTSFSETLRQIFDAFRGYIPYNYIGIATFADYDRSLLTAFHGISDGSFTGLPARLLGQTVELGSTSLNGILVSGQPRIIGDLESYAATRPPRDYTRIILEEGIRSSITLPLEVNGKAFGFLFFSSREKNVYTEMHVTFLSNIRNAIALAFEKDVFVDELVYSSTLALAKMAEARDEDTASHLERMRRYSVLLAELLRAEDLYDGRISPDFIHSLDRFSPMHDIGKVGIRDAVLLKPGRLDEEEMAHMRTHAHYGANVLREAENNVARSGRTFFTMGISIAEAHHEWWDGSGYPKGLSGEAIPLEARIVAVADVLDALTTRRPYKEPFPFAKSIDMILSEEGRHFDPFMARGLRIHEERFADLYEEFRRTMPEAY